MAISLESKEKVESVRHLLPDDVERVFVNSFNTSDWPILNYRISSERDLSNAYDMLERNLKRRVERLDNVSKVDLYGIEKREIQINIDLDRALAQQVNLARMLSELRASNFLITAGKITDRGRSYMVRPIGEIRTIEELENLRVDNNRVYLKDIADIAYENPRLTFGRHLDRSYAIGLDVFKTTGSNTVEVSSRVEAEVNEIAKLPEMEGVNVIFLDNQAHGIVSSIKELLRSGLLGALMAIIVLYFFLRNLTTTLIVTLAVPTSIVITLGFLYFLGLSLNILSMMGLMLAVGMLVDNAVVITENIHHAQSKEGASPASTLKGVKEVALAVTAGTLTTAIVFLPNIIASRDQLSIQLKHVALSIVIALACSLVIAQTIVPLMASRIKTIRPKQGTNMIDTLQKYYNRALRWTLAHHRLSILSIVLIILSLAIPVKFVKNDLFVESQAKRLRLRYHISGTYTVAKVEAGVDVIEDYLFANLDAFHIKSVYTYYTADYAQSTIYLKESKLPRPLSEIKEDLQAGLPILAIGEPSMDRERSGGEGELGIQLAGKSSEILASLSKEVARLLSSVDGLESVKSEAGSGDLEVRVRFDRDRVYRYGLTTSQVAQTVAGAMRGINLPDMRDDYGEINLGVQFIPFDERNMLNLENLPIAISGRHPVTLASLAKLEIVPGPRTIHRENRITSININAQLGDITTDEAREKIKHTMEQLELPPGYTWDFGSAFDFEDEAGRNMMFNTLLALAMIYFVMAALFESLIFPTAIWSSIFFAIIGVWWFFFISGTTFSIIAWIGVLILMGVVVNNGIVLIDHVNQLRLQGMPRNAAILQAGNDRMRAILMTAATTVLGLIPLSISNTQIGGDGPPYYPMARAIVGGLTFSTVVTLLILPTIYIMLDDLRIWSARIIRQSR